MDSSLEVFGEQFDASVLVHGSGGGFIHRNQRIALLSCDGGCSFDGIFQVAGHFYASMQVAMFAERVATGHQFVVVGQLKDFQQRVVHILLHTLIETYQPIGLVSEDTYQRGDDEDGNGTKRDFHQVFLFRLFTKIRRNLIASHF